MSEEHNLNKELIEQLKKSRTIVGEHSPVLIDFDGEVLSGRHRKEASWEKTETIDSRVVAEKLSVPIIVAKEVIRMHFNLQRKPSREETQESLLKIAMELEDKGVPKEAVASEVVKLVPYTERWVLELLPQEYKQPKKVEAGVKGAEVLQQKSLDADVQKQVQECVERAKLEPDEVEDLVKVVQQTPKEELSHVLMTPRAAIYQLYAKKPSPKPEVREWKPKEKPEQRVAVMHPQHSRMEEDLLLKLNEAGLHPITDKEFCIQTTTPDFYFPDKNLAIYIDGKPHENREDRDSQLRDLLAKRHNIRVISITYNLYALHEVERIFKQILEA